MSKPPEAAKRPVLEPNSVFDERLEEAFRTYFRVSLGHVRGQRRGLSPEVLDAVSENYSAKAGLPDDHPVELRGARPISNKVYVYNPEDYILLLAQALRKMNQKTGKPDIGLEITDEIVAIDKHEKEHGAMAKQLGLQSVYGVHIARDPRAKIWAVGPYHDVMGPVRITKLEEAAIWAAPQDLSSGDMLAIQSAGYSGREDVMERLAVARPDIVIPEY